MNLWTLPFKRFDLRFAFARVPPTCRCPPVNAGRQERPSTLCFPLEEPFARGSAGEAVIGRDVLRILSDGRRRTGSTNVGFSAKRDSIGSTTADGDT